MLIEAKGPHQPRCRRHTRSPSTPETLTRHNESHLYDGDEQYFVKNPNGYRCHANTGVKFPQTA
ncbi:hypothetical protein GCM10012276_13330 [Nocardioides deserti]|nr:hypothetical protein GCM10012276_13330 [Nocardioides deserti]